MPPARNARTKSRVLLVDDHAIVREGLASLLSDQKDLEVVAQAATAEEAKTAADKFGPDLAIVDLSLDDAHGISLIKDLKAAHPHLVILVLSMHHESLFAERALRAGASGYVMKQEASDRILAGVRRVLGGDFFVSERVASTVFQQILGGQKSDRLGLQALSDREMQIFQMIGRGKSTREIAASLFVSAKTIASHREHIRQKLKMDSAQQLARYAMQCEMEGI